MSKCTVFHHTYTIKYQVMIWHGLLSVGIIVKMFWICLLSSALIVSVIKLYTCDTVTLVYTFLSLAWVKLDVGRCITFKYFIYYPCWPLYVARCVERSGGPVFQNVYELLNLRSLKILMLYKKHIFQCMGMIFCVEFQRFPLKFHTKYLTHTLKDVDFIHRWKFKSS